MNFRHERGFEGGRGGDFSRSCAAEGSLKGHVRRGEGRLGDGFRRGGGFGGGGRRRMFESGELRLVFLLLLEAEPRHGYDLIREIETRTGGEYAPSPGVVYPTLTLLEELGFVEGRASDASKRLYAITEGGRTHLNENRTVAEAAAARLEQVRKRSEAVDSGPVFRAMSNLKTALRQRLADAGDKQVLFGVAEIIDEAARKIERL